MQDELVALDKRDVRDSIKEYLDSRGTKYKWLADKMGVSLTHISQILAKKRTLQEEHRQKINEVLNTNF